MKDDLSNNSYYSENWIHNYHTIDIQYIQLIYSTYNWYTVHTINIQYIQLIYSTYNWYTVHTIDVQYNEYKITFIHTQNLGWWYTRTNANNYSSTLPPFFLISSVVYQLHIRTSKGKTSNEQHIITRQSYVAMAIGCMLWVTV